MPCSSLLLSIVGGRNRCLITINKLSAPNLEKLDDRSRPLIFVGYEPGSKAYHAYDPTTKQVHVMHDVVFDEKAQWYSSRGGDQEEHGDASEFMVEYA